ncbi:MAG: hypothetical protein EHM77_03185 [Planctomycetaceae bacterium]|nr:MAG: hypothetical protein EHM77_03185 [Planctomycetaceae bacterium]
MLHQTIGAVTKSLETMSFNTGIARLMEFTNFFTRCERRPREAMEAIVTLLAPYAPHVAEELWQCLRGDERPASDCVSTRAWPQWDEAALVQSEIEVPVQINGKLRGKVMVPAGADEAVVLAAAREDQRIAEMLLGKTLVKSIYVPGRLVNLVIK